MISPHLDDAVVSCGALLLAHPGAVGRDVVRVFAGRPTPTRSTSTTPTAASFRATTRWPCAATRTCARSPRSARHRVGYRCSRTRTWNEPTRSPSRRARPTRCVATITDVRPSCVVAPLGLSHADHQACHASALAAACPRRRGAVALVQRPSLRVHTARARGSVPRAAQAGRHGVAGVPVGVARLRRQVAGVRGVRDAGAGARAAVAAPRPPRTRRASSTGTSTS